MPDNPVARKGDRVRLVRTTDPHTRLVPGDEGTVQGTDTLGTLSVKWDSGSWLGLLPDADEWEIVS